MSGCHSPHNISLQYFHSNLDVGEGNMPGMATRADDFQSRFKEGDVWYETKWREVYHAPIFPGSPQFVYSTARNNMWHPGNQVVDLNDHCPTLFPTFLFFFSFQRKRNFHFSRKSLNFFATAYQSMYEDARATWSCPGQGCHLDTFSSRDCHFNHCFEVGQKFWPTSNRSYP